MSYKKRAILKCTRCKRYYQCNGIENYCDISNCMCTDCLAGNHCNVRFLTDKEVVAYVL